MAVLWLLRIVFYIQLVLGVLRYVGLLDSRVWEFHLSLGIVIALLAPFALRPAMAPSSARLIGVAAVFPWLPLLIGLAMRFLGLPRDPLVVILHMLLGIIALALVEIAAARIRRAGVVR